MAEKDIHIIYSKADQSRLEKKLTQIQTLASMFTALNLDAVLKEEMVNATWIIAELAQEAKKLLYHEAPGFLEPIQAQATPEKKFHTCLTLDQMDEVSKNLLEVRALAVALIHGETELWVHDEVSTLALMIHEKMNRLVEIFETEKD